MAWPRFVENPKIPVGGFSLRSYSLMIAYNNSGMISGRNGSAMARKPANNPGLRKMGVVRNGEESPAGGGRDGEIVNLLAQIGDRLQRSEAERMAFKESMRDYSRSLESLESKSEQSESIFLTLQDKLSKQESAEANLRRRQERLEAEHRDQSERIEKAAMLVDRIEEMIELQERLSRRIDKITQDKARFIRKLDSIEEAVIETRTALEAATLALPAPDGVLALTGPLPPANDDPPPETAKAGTEPNTMRRTAAILGALLVLGVLVGLAMAGIGRLTGTEEDSAALETAALNPPAPPSFEQTPPRELADKEPAAAGQAAQAALAPLNPMTMSDSDIAAAFEKDPKALAAALNALEPQNLPSPVAVRDMSEPPPLPPSARKEAQESKAAAKPAPFKKPEPKPETAADEPAKTEPAKAEEAKAETSKAVQKEQPAAPKTETASSGGASGFDTDSFIKGETASGSLESRIKPDDSLTGGAAEIQRQAYNGIPEAQHDLAALYTAGRANIPVDYARAALWFREAALHGIANAQYNLGVLYHKGMGVPQDMDKALDWYRAAAAHNHPEAQYNLGIAHIEGIGAPYDPKQAMRYFRQAALQGVMEASYNLGLIYENGLLGDSQTDQALYWYRTAASQGSPEGRAAMNQLARAMKLGPKDLDRIYDKVRAEERAQGNTPPAADVPLEDLSSLGKTGDAAQPSQDQATLAQIQEQLVKRGLYPGPADGLDGQATEDAIRVYQRQNGLPQDGRPSQALLVNMLSGVTAKAPQAIGSDSLQPGDLAQPGGT